MARKNRIITGYHAIQEFLRGGVDSVLYVSRADLTRNKRVRAIEESARANGAQVRLVGRSEDLAGVAGISREAALEARGVVLVISGDSADLSSTGASVARPRQFATIDEFTDAFQEEESLVVLLDGVTDPQNFGAVLRSADQFAADLVIVPAHRSARQTDTVARISSGASAHVRSLQVPNLNSALDRLKSAGFWVFGADMAGTPAPSCSLSGRVALVMGSEGKGLSRLMRDRCDVLISIPTRGHIDSLNISVAAGILMYEVRRQQWKT